MELIVKLKNEEPVTINLGISCGVIDILSNFNVITFQTKFKRGLSKLVDAYNFLKDVVPDDIEYLTCDVVFEGDSPENKFNITATSIINIYYSLVYDGEYIIDKLVLEVNK